MGYHYGRRSLEHKKTLHPDLQTILDDAIEIVDLSVLCGYRGELEQNIAYDAGRSKLRFPESDHNRMPSRAMDTGIHPINWEDREAFMYMQGILRGIAHRRGIKLKPIIKWDLPHTALED
jgi:peptidoglycan L-alanyl-D-glutamate endopeptidase CwlK